MVLSLKLNLVKSIDKRHEINAWFEQVRMSRVSRSRRTIKHSAAAALTGMARSVRANLALL